MGIDDVVFLDDFIDNLGFRRCGVRRLLNGLQNHSGEAIGHRGQRSCDGRGIGVPVNGHNEVFQLHGIGVPGNHVLQSVLSRINQPLQVAATRIVVVDILDAIGGMGHHEGNSRLKQALRRPFREALSCVGYGVIIENDQHPLKHTARGKNIRPLALGEVSRDGR